MPTVYAVRADVQALQISNCTTILLPYEGGGAGTAVAGLTGNRDIDIPAEAIVRFKLADDLVVQEEP